MKANFQCQVCVEPAAERKCSHELAQNPPSNNQTQTAIVRNIRERDAEVGDGLLVSTCITNGEGLETNCSKEQVKILNPKKYEENSGVATSSIQACLRDGRRFCMWECCAGDVVPYISSGTCS